MRMSRWRVWRRKIGVRLFSGRSAYRKSVWAPGLSGLHLNVRKNFVISHFKLSISYCLNSFVSSFFFTYRSVTRLPWISQQLTSFTTNNFHFISGTCSSTTISARFIWLNTNLNCDKICCRIFFTCLWPASLAISISSLTSLLFADLLVPPSASKNSSSWTSSYTKFSSRTPQTCSASRTAPGYILYL